MEVIKQVNCPRNYLARFDVVQFKNNFADLMVKLSDELVFAEEVNIKYDMCDFIKKVFRPGYYVVCGGLVAAFAIITKR